MICTPFLAGKDTDMSPTTPPCSSVSVELECLYLPGSVVFHGHLTVWTLLVLLIHSRH